MAANLWRWDRTRLIGGCRAGGGHEDVGVQFDMRKSLEQRDPQGLGYRSGVPQRHLTPGNGAKHRAMLFDTERDKIEAGLTVVISGKTFGHGGFPLGMRYYSPGMVRVRDGKGIPEEVVEFKMVGVAVGGVTSRLADQSAVGAVNRPLLLFGPQLFHKGG